MTTSEPQSKNGVFRENNLYPNAQSSVCSSSLSPESPDEPRKFGLREEAAQSGMKPPLSPDKAGGPQDPKASLKDYLYWQGFMRPTRKKPTIYVRELEEAIGLERLRLLDEEEFRALRGYMAPTAQNLGPEPNSDLDGQPDTALSPSSLMSSSCPKGNSAPLANLERKNNPNPPALSQGAIRPVSIDPNPRDPAPLDPPSLEEYLVWGGFLRPRPKPPTSLESVTSGGRT
ncbi:MAG: hypothetical protein LBT38_09200 [Deltaproteobacteria bacterium]|jgi:hypothetical protein|nr:hypothetical protein [Deltaproteobacteria bacterium]